MRRVPRWSAIFLPLGVLLATLGGAPAARAEEDLLRDALYVRAGAVTGGMQGTLDHGLELGAGWDVPLGPGFVLGAGASFARDRYHHGFAENESRVLSFDGHFRWLLTNARIRPVLETGLGYYRYHHHWRYDVPNSFGTTEWGAPGGWLGVGTQFRLVEGFRARIGVAYHLIAQSTSYGGGNLEDYVASGLTLEYALP